MTRSIQTAQNPTGHILYLACDLPNGVGHSLWSNQYDSKAGSYRGWERMAMPFENTVEQRPLAHVEPVTPLNIEVPLSDEQSAQHKRFNEILNKWQKMANELAGAFAAPVEITAGQSPSPASTMAPIATKENKQKDLGDFVLSMLDEENENKKDIQNKSEFGYFIEVAKSAIDKYHTEEKPIIINRIFDLHKLLKNNEKDEIEILMPACSDYMRDVLIDCYNNEESFQGHKIISRSYDGTDLEATFSKVKEETEVQKLNKEIKRLNEVNLKVSQELENQINLNKQNTTPIKEKCEIEIIKARLVEMGCDVNNLICNSLLDWRVVLDSWNKSFGGV
jgi:hypothetical protein